MSQDNLNNEDIMENMLKLINEGEFLLSTLNDLKVNMPVKREIIVSKINRVETSLSILKMQYAILKREEEEYYDHLYEQWSYDQQFMDKF